MEFCPSRNARAVCGEVMVLQWTVVDRKGAMRVLKRMPSLSEKSLPQNDSWDKLDLGGASLRRTCIDLGQACSELSAAAARAATL